jgi:hypothetical protein
VIEVLNMAELEAAVGDRMHQCALIAVESSKIVCPVDTGKLQASIGILEEVPGVEVQWGSEVEYAPWVEWGHEIVLRGGIRTGRFVPPNPFLWNGVTNATSHMQMVWR